MIFHEHGQSLSVATLSRQSAQRRNQLNCSLIWAILKPQGAVVVVRGGETRRTVARSGDKISIVLVWQPKP